MQLVTVDIKNHEVLREPAKPVSFPLDLKVKKTIRELEDFFAALKCPFLKPAELLIRLVCQ